MKIIISFLILICLTTSLTAFQDSLPVTHFALEVTIDSYEAELLQIYDDQESCHFQGLFNAGTGFTQTLILPIETESLFVSLGDSLQAIAINSQMDKLLVDFKPPPPTWMQKLLWFKHDLEKVFPIIALVIIFMIKKNKDRKKELEEEEQ
ncbi:MAG: hypothetical protein K9M99_11465 [Candidatus Cloacimonetes bacterium]|nr:hypothetical protein [Candidatus Cloacimonadota bacterium]